MPNEDTNPALIRDIHSHRFTFRTRLRVGRIWRPKNYSGQDYDGLHYLLIDEKGDTIHAVIDEHTYPHMTQKMEEGQIYDIYQFHPKIDFSKLRIAKGDVQLTFNQSTKFVLINETSPPIPRHAFRLLQFHELAAELKDQTILADVYGCIKLVIPDHQVFVKEKNKMELICEFTVENLRREQLKINFWGDLGRDFDVEAIAKLPSPVFAIFTSLRASQFKRENTATGTRHTCVLFNPYIEEEEKYKAEFSKLGDKLKISWQKEGSQEKKEEKMKTVTQLHELHPDNYTKQTVLCKASIQRFSSSGGWWYRRCSKPDCYKQLKEKEDSDEFICVLHGVQTPLPHYKVYMTIQDNIDQAIVTLMGKPAEQLFGCSCQNLVNAASYQGGQILPEAIENAIGQEHIFEIKINYNGEFMVRSIVFDLELSKSAANKEPMNTTPEKPADRKRGMDAAATTLFSSDSEKKYKRQEKESASSSSAMKDESQNKKLD